MRPAMSPRLISPLVGEMSDRTEGGDAAVSEVVATTPFASFADISPTKGRSGWRLPCPHLSDYT